MRISDWSSDVCSSDLRSEFRPLSRSSSRSRTQGVQILHLPQLQDFRSERRRCSNRDRDLQLLDRARERRDNRTGWRRYERSQTTGRASCRDRVCQYVSISVGAVYLKKKNNKKTDDKTTGQQQTT